MMWDEKTKEHMKMHLNFPSKGSEILSACNSMSDVPEKDKNEFEMMVDPDKMYDSMSELKMDLEKEKSESEM